MQATTKYEDSKYKLFQNMGNPISLNSPDAEERLRVLNPISMLDSLEAQMKSILEDFGLPTDEPIRLIKQKSTPETRKFFDDLAIQQGEQPIVDKNLGDPNWPQFIKTAADALFRIEYTRKCIAKNDAYNAVFNCMYLQSHLIQLNLLNVEPLVGLGLETQQNTRIGGIRSGITRKGEAAEKTKPIIFAAQQLIKRGIPRRSLVSTLAQRAFGYSDKSIRKILRENGLY